MMLVYLTHASSKDQLESRHHINAPPFPSISRTWARWAAVAGLDLRVFTDGHRTGDHGAHLGALVTEALAAPVVPGGARRVNLAV